MVNDLFNFKDTDKRVTTFHNFKETPEVIGILKGFHDGDYGKQIILEYENKTITLGSYSALTEKLKEADIGKPVKIVFKGLQKSKDGKRTYMDFDVFIKEVK